MPEVTQAMQYPTCLRLQEEHPEITIVKIDTTDEELGKLADEEGVTVLPTFKFFKDGKEVRGWCRATVKIWMAVDACMYTTATCQHRPSTTSIA